MAASLTSSERDELKALREEVAAQRYADQKLQKAVDHYKERNALLEKEHKEDTYALQALLSDKRGLNDKCIELQERVSSYVMVCVPAAQGHRPSLSLSLWFAYRFARRTRNCWPSNLGFDSHSLGSHPVSPLP